MSSIVSLNHWPHSVIYSTRDVFGNIWNMERRRDAEFESGGRRRNSCETKKTLTKWKISRLHCEHFFRPRYTYFSYAKIAPFTCAHPCWTSIRDHFGFTLVPQKKNSLLVIDPWCPRCVVFACHYKAILFLWAPHAWIFYIVIAEWPGFLYSSLTTARHASREN